MNRILRFTVLLLAAFPLYDQTTAPSKAEQELMKIGTEIRDGLRRNDASMVERYFAPDWLYTTLEGQTVKGRAAIIAGLKSGTLKVETWEGEKAQWQSYGDTVVSSEIVTLKGRNNGQDVATRFTATNTFLKQKGHWQVVATQHTPLSAPVEKSQAEQEVVKLHQDWLAAIGRGDAEAIKRFLADDYVAIDQTGVLRDKAQALAETRPPAPTAAAVEVKPYGEGKIRFYGEMAVSTGGLSFSSPAGKQNLRYSTIAIKRQGQWQVVSSQVTLAKQ